MSILNVMHVGVSVCVWIMWIVGYPESVIHGHLRIEKLTLYSEFLFSYISNRANMLSFTDFLPQIYNTRFFEVLSIISRLLF